MLSNRGVHVLRHFFTLFTVYFSNSTYFVCEFVSSTAFEYTVLYSMEIIDEPVMTIAYLWWSSSDRANFGHAIVNAIYNDSSITFGFFDT